MFIYIFFEIKREDFYAMLIHHIATAILIFVSYIRGDIRIGVVILFIHDVTDIANSLVKMVNHIRWKKTAGLVFLFVMIGWFYWRIIIFAKVIYQTATNPHTTEISKKICVPLLVTLLILHMYWYYLFIQIFTQYFSHSNAIDLTEDKLKEKN